MKCSCRCVDIRRSDGVRGVGARLIHNCALRILWIPEMHRGDMLRGMRVHIASVVDKALSEVLVTIF